MRSSDRVVTRLPLSELFNDDGPVSAIRQRDLSAEDIRELIGGAAFQFVVAGVGAKLVWAPSAERFSFWKAEVIPHLAEPSEHVALDDFPGGYCYFASEWVLSDGALAVVLEVCH